MQVDDKALVPIQRPVPVDALLVILHHKSRAVGQRDVQIGLVHVVSQEVTFSRLHNDGARVVLGSLEGGGHHKWRDLEVTVEQVGVAGGAVARQHR